MISNKVNMCIFIVMVTSSGFACRPDPSSSDTQGAVSEGSDYLWPNAQASVCWEEKADDPAFTRYASLRQSIAATVTREFAKAGFTFTGWGHCHPGSRGLRVQQFHEVFNDGFLGLVTAFGRRGDGLYAGVKLVMNRVKSPACAIPEQCVLDTALHEFGHAIGLRHEANRRDSPCAADQTGGFGEEIAGMLPMTSYDPQSIMNYCGLRVNDMSGRVPQLSPGDISTIRAYYAEGGTPRQDACRQDGHSWIAENMQSCCQKSPTGRVPASRIYLFCDEIGAPPGERSTVTSHLVAYLPERPPQGHVMTLKCADGEKVGVVRPFNELKADLETAGFAPAANLPGIVFKLEKGTKFGDLSFKCEYVDIYNNASISGASGVQRFYFDQTVSIESPKDRIKQVVLNPSRKMTLSISNGQVEQASTSPSQSDFQSKRQLQPQPSTNSPTNVEPILPGKDGAFLVEVTGSDPSDRVMRARLLCDGIHFYSSSIAQGNQGSLVSFILPVTKDKQTITCTSLELGLNRFVNSDASSQAAQVQPGQGSAPKVTAYAAPITLKKPITMQLGGKVYATQIGLPPCYINSAPGQNIPTGNISQASSPTVSPAPVPQSTPAGQTIGGQSVDKLVADQVSNQPSQGQKQTSPGSSASVGGYTCEQQKSWGKCNQPWMHPVCDKVCSTP